MKRLNLENAGALLPAYLKNGNSPQIGIVHLGPGAFFRGHQAFYTDAAMAKAGGNWRICAVSMRSKDVAEALNPQDGLYALAEMEQDTQLSLIGSIAEVLVAPVDYAKVQARLTAASCKYVTMTITEKGYCLSSSGELDLNHADIAADLQLPDAVSQAKSAIGLLTQALWLRHRAGLPLLTLMSCDNLTDNGHKLKAAVRSFAANAAVFAKDVDFLLQLTDLICPCSMVDSITPATDDALRDLVSTRLGVQDAWPVKREAFCQWVVEDILPADQPAWREVGVIFTKDVTAFEKAKLRLLNAPHSTLAYLGSLLGIETVFDAMAQPQLSKLVQALVNNEILPSVPLVDGLNLAQYSADIFRRFENPSVRHLLAQIAWDGSQKLQMRLLPVIRDNLAAGRSVQLLALAIASWLQFIRLRAQQAQQLGEQAPALVDPLAPLLLATAAQCTGDARTDVPLWLALDSIFAADLINQTAFVSALWQAYQQLSPFLNGASADLSQFLSGVDA
ncbi:mannitol dehydrogenase family protein [Rheinheimera texasensis]|uniref:mannitol dehydrogenase family protein n=1 Tax=Rheinheimera texasensis TaxID=306205 RepID=UPI0004E0BFD7|nr:mannitol dehydrogenase family protein [Rheinheimera texasensis]